MSVTTAVERLGRIGRSTLRRFVKPNGLPVLLRGLPQDRREQRIPAWHHLSQLQAFEAALNRQGRSLRQCEAILEFGCGYGRLTKYLSVFAPQARVFGCDIWAEDIALCRRRFPAGTFLLQTAPRPPLPMADSLVDLIFSYSVFTHLSEANHSAWLKELGRLLKPGGLMLHTTHSYACLRLMALFSPERLEKYALGMDVEQFIASDKGYHYAPEEADQSEYGLTIISRDYVMTQWPNASGLRLLDYAEGAIESYPEGCQDLVVLTKDT